MNVFDFAKKQIIKTHKKKKKKKKKKKLAMSFLSNISNITCLQMPQCKHYEIVAKFRVKKYKWQLTKKTAADLSLSESVGHVMTTETPRFTGLRLEMQNTRE